VVDDRDPVGEGVGLGHVVGDEQDCLPGGLQSGDDVVDGQRLWGSRPVVGSSRNSTSGWCMMARPIISRCAIPPYSSSTRLPAASARLT